MSSVKQVVAQRRRVGEAWEKRKKRRSSRPSQLQEYLASSMLDCALAGREHGLALACLRALHVTKYDPYMAYYFVQLGSQLLRNPSLRIDTEQLRAVTKEVLARGRKATGEEGRNLPTVT